MLPTIDSEQLVAFARQFNNVALLTYLVPLAVGLRRWKVLLPAYRPLVWFVLLPGGILNGLLAEIGRHVWHNNIIFLQLATVGETLCLGWAYYYAFHSARSRKILVGALAVFLAVCLVEHLYINRSLTGPDMYAHMMQSIILIAAAVAYFEQTLRELRNIDLGEDPIFMVSVGTILYYAGTIMVFMLEGQLQSQPNLIWIMYIIQFVLLIVFNAFLAIALWHGHRQEAAPSFVEDWPAQPNS